MTNVLIQLGSFTLNSGATSTFKLECDQFIDDNLAGLVALIRQMVGPYKAVIGVPRGGLVLAKALEEHVTKEGSTLLVDDVLTTGGSMMRSLRVILKKDEYCSVKGVVVFARGRCPFWITPLFQMPISLWLETDHE